MSALQEGRIPNAERLLEAAKVTGGRVINMKMVDGKRVGDWVNEVESALLTAKRSVSIR